MNRMRMAAFLCAACLAFTGGAAAFQEPTTMTVTAATQNAPGPASGECGAKSDTVSWAYDGAGTLTISGTGAMADFDYSTQPWKDLRKYIKSAEISDGVVNIGCYAFYSCSAMQTLSIPASVETIGDYAFESLSALVRYDVAEGNQNFASVDGVLFTKDLKELISYPRKKDTAVYTVPDGTAEIGKNAFQNCNALTKAIIPDSVTVIGSYAFNSCVNMTEITIPDSVTSIGNNAFISCSSLTNIAVGENNEKYSSKDGALYSKDQKTFICYPLGQKDTSYTIPDGVTKIDKSAFWYCPTLTEIIIPESVTQIGEYAFVGCKSLAHAALPSGLTSIEWSVFSGCSALEEATIPESVTSINYRAFEGCEKLKEITIPEKVTSIGSSAFNKCTGLTAVTVMNPECRITNGEDTFPETAVIYGYAGSTAEEYAEKYSRTFEALEGGAERTGSGTCGKDGENLTWEYDGKGTLTITGTGEMADYAVDDISTWAIVPWKSFTKNIQHVVIGDGVKNIGSGAFRHCTNLTDISISDSVTGIRNYIFAECSSLKAVTLPAGVKELDEGAFGGNNGLLNIEAEADNPNYSSKDGLLYNKDQTKLISYPSGRTETEFVIPDHTAEIASYAFSGTASLKKVTIPESVNILGWNAFYECPNLETVVLPADMTEMNNSAFYRCNKLTAFEISESNEKYCTKDGILFSKDMTQIVCYPQGKTETAYIIPDSVNSVGNSAFSGCKNLTEIKVPESVTGFGDSAFSGCTNLTALNFPRNLRGIGNTAFSGCESLTKVEIPDGVEKLEGAFYSCYGLTEVKLPKGLHVLDSYTFAYCTSLKTVIIPEELTTVKENAFANCYNLEELTFPISVAVIEHYAFYSAQLRAATIMNPNCDIQNGSLPSGTVIYGYADSTAQKYAEENKMTFCEIDGESPDIIAHGTCGAEGDNLKWTYDKNGVLTISGTGSMMDYNYMTQNDSPWTAYATSATRGVSAVAVEEGVTRIGDEAFYQHTEMKSITLPSSLTEIGSRAFYGCSSLTSITLPANMKMISESTFCDCSSLTEIRIPDSVTEIGYDVFENCTSLKKLNIPAGLTTIKGNPCKKCPALSAITVAEDNPNYCAVDGVLFTKDMKTLMCYPAGKTDSEYALPDGVTNMELMAFAYNEHLTNVTLPDSITCIYSFVFSNCKNLKEITIPDSVRTIYNEVFEYCTSLTKVTLPKDLTSISSETFYGCTSLKEINIPDKVTYIGSRAFYNCKALTEIALPETVKKCEDSAFSGCTGLTKITFENPDCAIYDKKETISDTAVIYGYDDSTAHEYADKYGREFVALPGSKPRMTTTAPATTTAAGGSSTTTTTTTTTDAATTTAVTTTTAPAAYKSVSFDEGTGTLTLKGNVDTDEIRAFAKNKAVKKVVCAEGAVLPENCAYLFSKFTADSIDLSNADSSKVTNMEAMFEGCDKLTELNLSGLDTSNVTTMEKMFYRCDHMTELDVSCFDTSCVSNMNGMFAGCMKLTKLDVSGFDTSKVEDFGWMFDACAGLTELDVSRFDTSKAQNMERMFSACSGLKELDLSAFDTEKVKDMDEMFEGSEEFPTNLKTIYVSDKWSTASMEDSDKMFKGCTELTGGNGTKFDGSHTDGAYARIDTADAPGYFTRKTAEPVLTTGDTDGDGEIGNRDAMLLIRYVNGWEGIELDLSAADIDGDGEIGNRDAMLLIRYVNGWEGYDKYFQ